MYSKKLTAEPRKDGALPFLPLCLVGIKHLFSRRLQPQTVFIWIFNFSQSFCTCEFAARRKTNFEVCYIFWIQKNAKLAWETLRAESFQIFIIHTSVVAKENFQVTNFFPECGPESRAVLLLASLEVTGVGINLTAASRIHFLEPCWDLQEQAIDCVHCIGQKEEVKVIRLVVRKSIEQRILELRGQVENNRDREMSRLGFQDIQTIMGM